MHDIALFEIDKAIRYLAQGQLVWRQKVFSYTNANNQDLFQSLAGRRELELEVDVSTTLAPFN